MCIQTSQMNIRGANLDLVYQEKQKFSSRIETHIGRPLIHLLVEMCLELSKQLYQASHSLCCSSRQHPECHLLGTRKELWY